MASRQSHLKLFSLHTCMNVGTCLRGFRGTCLRGFRSDIFAIEVFVPDGHINNGWWSEVNFWNQICMVKPWQHRMVNRYFSVELVYTIILNCNSNHLHNLEIMGSNPSLVIPKQYVISQRTHYDIVMTISPLPGNIIAVLSNPLTLLQAPQHGYMWHDQEEWVGCRGCCFWDIDSVQIPLFHIVLALSNPS